jgi:hypothetical protein
MSDVLYVSQIILIISSNSSLTHDRLVTTSLVILLNDHGYDLVPVSQFAFVMVEVLTISVIKSSIADADAIP